MNCNHDSRVATLRQELAAHEGFRPCADRPPIGTGAAGLDRLLPAGGLRPGSLVEYLAPQGKQGAATLALVAARTACQDGRLLVVCDRQRRFYPPAAAAWGLDLKNVLLLRPSSEAEELWALDQALRCPGVGAAWIMCGALGARDFRRLQLAAEVGGTLGLFIRPAKLRGRPTWADVQWLVEPRPADPRSPQRGWRLSVELVRCRGGTGGGSVQLEFDEEQNIWREANDSHAADFMPALAELAHPAAARRASRA
jgi:hypothetical protein